MLLGRAYKVESAEFQRTLAGLSEMTMVFAKLSLILSVSLISLFRFWRATRIECSHYLLLIAS